MKQPLLAFIFLLVTFVQCSKSDEKPFEPINQVSEIETVNYYGTFNQYIKLTNGEYLICGGATFEDGAPGEMLMFNIGSDHQLKSKKNFQIDGYINPVALSVCEIDPSSYLVAADLKLAESGQYEVAVMEMNDEGTLSTPIHNFSVTQPAYWARILKDGGSAYYVAYLDQVLEDVNIVESSLIVKKFNADHEELWSTELADVYWQPYLRIGANGDLLIAGSSHPDVDFGNRDITSARISPSGEVVYKENFDGVNKSWDVGFSLVESTEGGVILSGQITDSNTPVLISLDASGGLGNTTVLSKTMYIHENEVEKIASGYLVTTVFRHQDNVRSINLMKMNKSLKTVWSHNMPLEPTDLNEVRLVNSVAESDGSASIAVVDLGKLKIIRTNPL